MDRRPNRLLIAIQPEEGILLRFEVKHPGPAMQLSPVMMQFYYREAFKTPPPEAYETLLLDVMRGDCTLFHARRSGGSRMVRNQSDSGCLGGDKAH